MQPTVVPLLQGTDGRWPYTMHAAGKVEHVTATVWLRLGNGLYNTNLNCTYTLSLNVDGPTQGYGYTPPCISLPLGAVKAGDYELNFSGNGDGAHFAKGADMSLQFQSGLVALAGKPDVSFLVATNRYDTRLHIEGLEEPLV